jgi:serine/threonine-protein kinase
MMRCPTCGGKYEGMPESCPLDGARLERADDSLIHATVGAWRLTGQLAAGPLSTVYRAKRGGTVGALKLYRSGAPISVDRILRESAALGTVRHPGVAALLDHGVADGRPYLVTQLVEGRTLRAALDESQGALPCAAALRIAAGVADALDAVHAVRLVHRDLKPENVMLCAAAAGEDGPRPTILDLGHAISMDLERLTESGLVWGSAPYMAPEQAAAEPVDGRADLYSLGVMLFEMLVGRLPFEAPSAVEIMHLHRDAVPPAPAELAAVPVEASDACLWLLAKSPAERPPSARAAQAVLSAITRAAAG